MKYISNQLLTKEIEINYEAINIKEILMYLGCKEGSVDEDTINAIKSEINNLINIAVPRCVICNISLSLEGNKRFLVDDRNKVAIEGDSINDLLKDCSEVIIFSTTLGIEVDQYIRKLQILDIHRAIVADAVASGIIETICNQVNLEAEKYFRSKELYCTDRFSAGYGDFSLENQRDILKILESHKTVGIKLNDSLLMIPRKSVSAIIGISSYQQRKSRVPCDNCILAYDCQLKDKGEHCGKYK